MSKRDLRRKIEQLREARLAGARDEEEAARHARVVDKLEALAQKRRLEYERTHDSRSPIQIAREEGDLEKIAEFERIQALIAERRRGGGGR